jgi:hypothetical protein
LAGVCDKHPTVASPLLVDRDNSFIRYDGVQFIVEGVVGQVEAKHEGAVHAAQRLAQELERELRQLEATD